MKNKEQKEVVANKTTLKEKLSLKFRKKWLVSKTTTILMILILLAGYVALNLWVKTLDLPEIDVTENKIYTLSDASKNAVKDINQEVKIYAYGFEENGSLIKLLKQYNNANENIKYEIINEESNYAMIQEHDLQEGYFILILQSGGAEKIIDGSTDFSSYDFTTYQQIDTTEQTITNSILALTETNKPKVYFVQGHGEYTEQTVQVLRTYLQNEAFEVADLNIATTGAIPDDCNVLVIMSPSSDLLDAEAQAIKDYINKGGDIYFGMDVVSDSSSLTNFQSVLDEYGVSVDNGYIAELADNQSMANYPYIFMPQLNSAHKITEDIFTDSYMWLVYSARLKFKETADLEALNVTKETLLNTTDQAMFITDLNANIQTAAQTAETGQYDVASIVTKKVTTTNEAGEEQSQDSNLVIIASASFISDYQIAAISQNYPLSYIGSNKDFVINSIAYLGDKGNNLTIRKDMANSTYTPTETQNRVVITLIFAVPIAIIAVGIAIGAYRKKRK